MADSKPKAFVEWVLSKTGDSGNKGLLARLRKAESETTESQAWEALSRWIDLEKPWERQAYGLIGASLSRLKSVKDGSLGLGGALRFLWVKRGGETKIEDSSEAMRLRRLLSCRDQNEALDVIRPLLRYLTGQDVPISHAILLEDLLWFNIDASQERIKLRWAKEFYVKSGEEEDD